MKNYQKSSKKGENMKKSMRGGFTMLELVFVLIVIAVLTAIFMPKIISQSDKNQISAVLSSDIDSLYNAIAEWRKTSTESDGSFSNLTTAKLEPYLPYTMKLKDPDGTPDNGDEYITSSELGGNIHYQVASYKITKNGDSFKVYIDASAARSSNSWTTDVVKYTETKGMNILVRHNTNKDSTTYTKQAKATAIGSANSSLGTNGGTNNDAKFGVEGLVY